MSREFDLVCEGYDTLLVSMVAPETSTVHIRVRTDCGVREYESGASGAGKREHALSLSGAARIAGIEIEVEEGPSGARAGWINWIGLQSGELVSAYERQWSGWDSSWEGYLRPHAYEPSFKPSYGILVNADELGELRRTHRDFVNENSSSPFTRAADALRGIDPEDSIGEYVGFYSSTRKTGDTRYNRERDEDKGLVCLGQQAAVAGLLMEDAALLRLAARYAMSLAMCGFWEDGMVNRVAGSTFDTRCFVQSLCLHDIAMILDLAGEMFTDLGREYLLRRLSQEGLATVTYNTWKYEYLFHCNQLAWFSPGRMYAHLVVERSWPRAEPYTELCLNDLIENMDLSILDDGGYVEGPNYFQCVGRDACLSFYYYARARGIDLDKIVPAKVLRTAELGAAIESTDERQDVIPICDANPAFDQTALAFLDHLMPGRAWSRMLAKSLRRTGLAESIVGLKLTGSGTPGAEGRPAPPASLVVLPDMGLVTSTRLLAGEKLKLFVMGNHAGAGHTHEDKGSFVLELAGETFAMDPGTADYSYPLSSVLKQCQRHNMLVPVGTTERPRPESPIPVDVKPAAEGDDQTFSCSIDITPGWERYFRSRTRRWSSPTPEKLVIEDEYELERGDGVEFYWQTELDVTIDGKTVEISGHRAVIRLYGPEDCEMRIDELPLPGGRIARRAVFARAGRSGVLAIRAELAPVRQ